MQNNGIPSIAEQLVKALRERKSDWSSNPHLASLDGVFNNLTGFIGATGTKRAELEKRGTLTHRGVRDELQDFADGAMIPELRRARERVNQARADLKLRRASLSKPKIDPADVAAAVLRQDMRAYVRSLEPLQRAATLLNSKTDPAILAAVLEAPDVMSGLSLALRDDVARAYAAIAHPEGAKEIEATDEGLSMMETILSAAENDISTAIGPAIAA